MTPDTTLFTPLLWQGLLLSLGINLLFFLLALVKQSDHFTDITYSLTFIALGLFYTLRLPLISWMDLIALTLVIIWSVRLGSYLLMRIFWMGRDARFDRMRGVPLRFLTFWLLQALSVWVILLPLYVHQLRPLEKHLGLIPAAGLAIWLLGLTIETLADMQKFIFKLRHPEGKWIDQGLWHLSRHPNFFGEMLVWWGFFLFILPSTWPMLALSSGGPVFITLLLRFVSGVPMLEKSARKKYGHLPEFQTYLRSTRLLLPLPRLR